jgi:hypothetical protein
MYPFSILSYVSSGWERGIPLRVDAYAGLAEI